MAFWESFWPNAAATVTGVALGVPTALWLNRLAMRSATQRAEEDQLQRLGSALDVLIAALKHNYEILSSYPNVLGESRARWLLQLDTAAWDAIHGDLHPTHVQPALRRQLAFHFSSLPPYVALNAEYLQFAFGTNASMSGSEQTRGVLRTQLIDSAKSLANQATELIAESEALKLRILSRGRSAT